MLRIPQKWGGGGERTVKNGVFWSHSIQLGLKMAHPQVDKTTESEYSLNIWHIKNMREKQRNKEQLNFCFLFFSFLFIQTENKKMETKTNRPWFPNLSKDQFWVLDFWVWLFCFCSSKLPKMEPNPITKSIQS